MPKIQFFLVKLGLIFHYIFTDTMIYCELVFAELLYHDIIVIEDNVSEIISYVNMRFQHYTEKPSSLLLVHSSSIMPTF